MTRVPAPGRVLSLLVACRARPRGLPLPEAAALLGVEPSCVEEVAEALTGLGIPPLGPDDYLDVEVDRGRVHVHQDQALGKPPFLSALDGALLLACLRASASSLPGEIAALRRETEERIRAAVAPQGAEEAERRSGTLAWGDEGGFEPGTLGLLLLAARERRELSLRYFNHSRDAVETRRTWPLSVVQHTGRWYLSAWSPADSGHRLFRLDRIVEAHDTGSPFELDEDLPELRRDVMFLGPSHAERVDVRFDAGCSSRAACLFRSAELLESSEDGVLLALRGPTIPVVLRELFAFGYGWEVTAPLEARALVLVWCRGPGAGAG